MSALKNQLTQISKKLGVIKDQKNKIFSELKRLDVDLGKGKQQIQALEQSVQDLNRILDNNRQQIISKRFDIGLQKEEVAKLARVAYGLGGNEVLKLLLSQRDPAVSGRVVKYYEYFSHARLTKINQVNQNLEALRHLEEERVRESQLLEQKLKHKQHQQEVLLKTINQRKLLLSKIDKQYKAKTNQLKRIKEDKKKLEKLIASLQQVTDRFSYNVNQNQSFHLLKGKLPWPVPGKIVKRFGEKRSDTKWDGVVLQAKPGQQIRAVAKGRVVFADWLRGYGLLTIIDHGKGFMTLYAFSQSLYKSVGDQVKEGTVVATVGQSGGQVEAGLYFGVRKNMKPIDPAQWCRKKKRK